MGTFIQTCGDVKKNKTHLDRKIGEARVQDLQQDDCWEYDETQLFEDHDTLHRRLGKSLYYGGSESTSVDSLSFPLTQICVDHFNSVITESASNEQDIAADS